MRERLTARNASMLAAALAVTVLGVLLVLVVRDGGGDAVGAGLAAGREPDSTAAKRPPAPTFSLETVDGVTFSLVAQQGKVVVLDFLEAGCPSCATEVPVLDTVATRFAGSGVAVLIVDVSGAGDSELRRYYRGELGASRRVSIAADLGYRVAGSYRPTSMPAGFVIGRDGRITWQGTVGDTPATLTRAIRAAGSN